jgi:hypothetical protein
LHAAGPPIARSYTDHRVLPKHLTEPINRLIAVVSNLHRNHVETGPEA